MHGLILPKKRCDIFRSTSGVCYDQHPVNVPIGFKTIKILDNAIGKVWGNEILEMLHSFRPSKIRVTTGECTTDSALWRVTVIVDSKDVIQSITQEVEFVSYK